MREIIIGSRESMLAVAQTKIVMDYINENCKGVNASMLTMKTTGDKILDRTLDKVGGKGLFVKELDRALVDGRTMLSVHSLKDLPVETNEKLTVIGYIEGESAADVLVLPLGAKEIDFSKPIGTASGRRAKQFLKLYPNAIIKPVRGNLQTRLSKLDGGEYGALILAEAGLRRLGLEERISRKFTVDEIIPAAGQGVIAVQGRAGEKYDFLLPLFSQNTKIRVECERAFVKRLNGGCSAPIAAHCTIKGEKVILYGYFYNEDTGKEASGKVTCGVLEAINIANNFADDLRNKTI